MGTATVDSSVPESGNPLIDGLVWGSAWQSVGPTTITVGYWPDVFDVDRFGNETGVTRSLTAAEISVIERTLAEYEKYINVDFVFIGEDPNENADIQFVLSNDKSTTNYGEAYPPGEQGYDPVGNPGFSEVRIFTSNYENRSGALLTGDFDFITFIHEFGHAMGLAHPHDDGGTPSDPSEIFPGVDSAFGDYGDFELNQGIFTTMSYNDGWPSDVRNTNKAYGYQGGMMALDIQALQHIYGANTTYANGNDDYTLPTNTKGAYYACIWDTGGVDEIIMNGTKACTIDLRAATGQLEEGGGGFVSFVKGVKGGLTIAVDVTIENATGGKSTDTFIGNNSNNIFTGNGNKDTYTGNGGSDQFVFLTLKDTSTTATRADLITDFQVGLDDINLSAFDIDSRTVGVQTLTWDFIDEAAFTAAGQINSFYNVKTNQTFISINTDADTKAEAMIVLSGNVDLTDNDFIFI